MHSSIVPSHTPVNGVAIQLNGIKIGWETRTLVVDAENPIVDTLECFSLAEFAQEEQIIKIDESEFSP